MFTLKILRHTCNINYYLPYPTPVCPVSINAADTGNTFRDHLLQRWVHPLEVQTDLHGALHVKLENNSISQ